MRSLCARLSLLSVLFFLAAFTTNTFAKSPAPAQADSGATVTDRITQSIDVDHTVTLGRNTRPEANHQNDRGALPEGVALEHMLLLLQHSPEQEAAVNKLIDEQNDRNSPNFHKWLTAEEYGERFGVSVNDLNTVKGWLESQGFRINQVYANHMVIDISGTAGQLRDAFHVSMHQLEVNGETHIANMNDPRIPAALAPVVKGFASLNDFKRHANYMKKPDYTFAGCASSSSVPTEPGTCYAITPQDNAVIYNLNPLWSNGITGTGQTIALLEDTDTYGGANDWNSYRTAFGLTSYGGTYTQLHPGGCTDPGTNADDGEAAIDVEMATSFAPAAAIQLISCPSAATPFGGLIALTNLTNGAGPYPNVVSMSYGVCEAFNGNGGNAAFYNTFQLAATEGISVFASAGDSGPSSCSDDFSVGTEYTSLGVTGWGETPYNVTVGGTDFEDVYNAKDGSPSNTPLSTYWSSTNSATYGSAKSYIPEMPWNDACADTLISEYANSTFVTYGTTGTCNKSTFDKSTSYLSNGAGSGGASNCATGSGGANTTSALLSEPQCQGYPKPSYQSGSSLAGGAAAYGQPNDGLRDIPGVSMFAANGVWGHFETVCWSDPTQTSGGAASCSGSPSTWSGFGGTSVASPSLAGIQALVNQQTGDNYWGNPNPIYYQIAQNEYGTAGGSFLGSSCNSSGTGGPAAGCAFNDVAQGDIDAACSDNGTASEAHCYKPSSTYGVVSTDNVTAATVINGGSGYTSAPTCTIAGPTNSNPYKEPNGTVLWAGGTQAACTAAFNAGSNTAKWTVAMSSADGDGDTIVLTTPPGAASPVTCGPYTLAGSTSAMASGLVTAIGSGCSLATATSSGTTVTLTARTAGAAGNFVTEFGTGTIFQAAYIAITNTVLGEGPGYVSGITITTAGSGYQPETPITLTGGGGTGAIAVANTSPATAAQSYQPAYGAAPGYDMATGLGTVNAYFLVCNTGWASSTPCPQSITFSTAPPASAAYGSSFTVVANASSGLAVSYTSSGSCSNSGATYTITSGSGTCSVIVNQSGNGSFSAAPTVTDTVNATPGVVTVAVTSVNPSTESYGLDSAVTITATVSWTGTGSAPTASDVTIGGNGPSSYGPTSCTAGSGDSLTCSAIYTPTTADGPGSYNETASFSGDGNYSAASSSQTSNFSITSASAGTVVTSSGSPSTYGQPVTFTATISGQNGNVKSRIKQHVVTGTVAWSANTGCGTTTVSSGNPGVATCTTSTLAVGTDNVTANYSGDSNHSASSGSFSQSVNQATSSISVSSVSPAAEDYGSTAPVAITAQLSWSGSGSAPTASDVSISGSGLSGSLGSTTCGSPSSDTLTCSATYTPSGTDAPGSYTFSAAFSGDTNYSSSSSSQTSNFTINSATSTTGVTSSPNPSTYAQQVVFTATINGENGNVKGRITRNGVKQHVITGTVSWSANTGCGTTAVTSGNPGVATCTTSSATRLPVGNDTVTATYSGDANHGGSQGSERQTVQGGIPTTISVTSVSPSSEDFAADAPVTISAELTWTGIGKAPTASDVTISGNGNGTYGATTCAARSGDTITCQATYTPTNADVAGSYNETAAFSGDANYAASNSTQTGNFTINAATSTTAVGSSGSPSTYGQSVTFTATINGENGDVKGAVSKRGVKRNDVTGPVTWSGNTGCGTTTVTSGNPGIASCTTSSLAGGTDSVTATYSGDSNHGGWGRSFSQKISEEHTTR